MTIEHWLAQRYKPTDLVAIGALCGLVVSYALVTLQEQSYPGEVQNSIAWLAALTIVVLIVATLVARMGHDGDWFEEVEQA